eukprot:jgi/Hompol1/6272/HPOL_004942-RA
MILVRLLLASIPLEVDLSFTVTLPPEAKPGPVNVKTTNAITLTWSTDSCAGAIDQAGNPVPNASPQQIGGRCSDSKGNPVNINPNAVFPTGLSTLRLRRGLGSNSTSTDLLPTVQNTAALAGNTRQVTISNLASYPSDYYALIIVATDANGNLVHGQSQFFGIQNTDPLPPMGQIQLWSPLDGSYWLANSQYRIRWALLASSIPTDFFYIDLLTPDNLLVARLLDATSPNTGDLLLGAGNPLNYTAWTIDPALRNKQFRLRITGLTVVNGVINNITAANPIVTSGVFFVGPAKPSTLTVSAAWSSTSRLATAFATGAVSIAAASLLFV